MQTVRNTCASVWGKSKAGEGCTDPGRQARTWLAVALLREGYMAHTLVVWVGLEVTSVLDVVKVLDLVLVRHLSQDVNVAVGTGV
jgi:hypothetical protein